MPENAGKRGETPTEGSSAFWPMTLLTALALLLLGGITPLTTGIVAVLVLLATLSVHLRNRLVPNGLALSCALLALLTLLQTLPLPAALTAFFSPAGATAWRETLGLLDHNSSFLPLSIEPSATRLEALKLTSYALFALLCERAAIRGARRLCAALAGVAVLVAAVTLGHQLLAAERVFGWYRPQHSAFIGPLLNTNNLGGLLNLGFFAAAGLALDPRLAPAWRHAALLACAFLAGGSLWVGSRAGVALLLLGTLLLSGFVLRAAQHKDLVGPRKGVGLLLLSLLLGGGLAAFSAVRLRHELLDDSLEKLEVLRPAWATLREYWLSGAGRGGFSAALAPHLATTAAPGSFEHAENFLLQWAVDWGLLVAVPLLALLIYWLWPRRDLLRASPSRLGAYVAVLVLWLHNLADFSLELPALALCATVAAAAAGLLGRGRGFDGAVWRKLFVPVVAALVLLQLAGLVFAPVELGRGARQRLAQASGAQQLRFSELREALLKHPADGYLLRLAAAAKQGDPNALAWVGLALRRSPNSGRTLLLLADVVQRRGGTPQALGALRRALRVEPVLADEAAARAVRWAPERADAIVPEGPFAGLVLESLANHATSARQRLAYRFRAANLATASLEQRVALLTEAARASEADCAAIFAQACGDFVRSARAQLGTAETLGLIELDASLLLARGESRAAFQLLQERCPRTSVGVPCLYSLLGVASRLELAEQLSAGELLLRVACARDAACAGAEAQVGARLLTRGEPALALPHLRHAAELEPTAARWLEVAESARAAAQLHPLVEALTRLRELGAAIPQELLEAQQQLEQQIP